MPLTAIYEDGDLGTGKGQICFALARLEVETVFKPFRP